MNRAINQRTDSFDVWLFMKNKLAQMNRIQYHEYQHQIKSSKEGSNRLTETDDQLNPLPVHVIDCIVKESSGTNNTLLSTVAGVSVDADDCSVLATR